MLAPIVLFVYNRPWHTEQTLNALMQNELADQSILYIYADGAKEDATEEQLNKITEVRNLIRSKNWCAKVHIIETERNRGLVDSIIKGVTEIVNQHGKVIVLEDDLVTSKGFLNYMNEALRLYQKEQNVYHVSGYMYPLEGSLPDTLFLNVVTPWGWGTWKDRWQYFNSDANDLMQKLMSCNFFSQNDYNAGYGTEFFKQLEANVSKTMKTWAVKWHTSIYLKHGYCLHPGNSLVRNIGFDNSGTHCGSNENYSINQLSENIQVYKIPIVKSKEILEKFQAYYKMHNPILPVSNKIIHRIISFFKQAHLAQVFYGK